MTDLCGRPSTARKSGTEPCTRRRASAVVPTHRHPSALAQARGVSVRRSRLGLTRQTGARARAMRSPWASSPVPSPSPPTPSAGISPAPLPTPLRQSGGDPQLASPGPVAAAAASTSPATSLAASAHDAGSRCIPLSPPITEASHARPLPPSGHDGSDGGVAELTARLARLLYTSWCWGGQGADVPLSGQFRSPWRVFGPSWVSQHALVASSQAVPRAGKNHRPAV